MRRTLLVGIVGLLALFQPAMAADNARPSAKATRGGFVAVASIVTDPNWREIWNTPAETTPYFHTTSKMEPGDKAWLLTFFAGAKLKGGVAQIKCDLKIIDPDGSIDSHPAQLCYQGPIPGPEGSLFMTGLEVGLEVTAKDLDGLTTFEIGITDVNRGVRVPVKVSVEFDTGRGAT